MHNKYNTLHIGNTSYIYIYIYILCARYKIYNIFKL